MSAANGEARITVLDQHGPIEITLADLLKYHGQDFVNGLVQCLKLIELATRLLNGGKPMQRRRIRLVLGLSPPGIVDGLEYITRAFSDRRAIIDPDPPKGPDSYNGRYYFEVHYDGRKLAAWLKDGIVPDGYTLLAKRGFLGLLDATEMATWRQGKQQIADLVMRRPAEEVFEFEVSPGT
jgi:hypothetical protein